MFWIQKHLFSRNSSSCCFIRIKLQEDKNDLENVLCFYFISKSSSSAYIILSPGSDIFLFVCCSVFYFSFVCAPNFFMNKNTIETIQTNIILRVFIAAKIIHSKANLIWQRSYKKLRIGLTACRSRKERFSLLQFF